MRERACWRCGSPVTHGAPAPTCEDCGAQRDERIRTRERRHTRRTSRSSATPPVDAIAADARKKARVALGWLPRPRHWWEDVA